MNTVIDEALRSCFPGFEEYQLEAVLFNCTGFPFVDDAMVAMQLADLASRCDGTFNSAMAVAAKDADKAMAELRRRNEWISEVEMSCR